MKDPVNPKYRKQLRELRAARAKAESDYYEAITEEPVDPNPHDRSQPQQCRSDDSEQSPPK